MSQRSTIGCGLVQAHYAFANVSHKSFITVKYFIKMLSSTSDSIIFLFLGMVLVNDTHQWHTAFVLWVLFLCLAVRFTGTPLLWNLRVFSLNSERNCSRTPSAGSALLSSLFHSNRNDGGESLTSFFNVG